MALLVFFNIYGDIFLSCMFWGYFGLERGIFILAVVFDESHTNIFLSWLAFFGLILIFYLWCYFLKWRLILVISYSGIQQFTYFSKYDEDEFVLCTLLKVRLIIYNFILYRFIICNVNEIMKDLCDNFDNKLISRWFYSSLK